MHSCCTLNFSGLEVESLDSEMNTLKQNSVLVCVCVHVHTKIPSTYEAETQPEKQPQKQFLLLCKRFLH